MQGGRGVQHVGLLQVGGYEGQGGLGLTQHNPGDVELNPRLGERLVSHVNGIEIRYDVLSCLGDTETKYLEQLIIHHN